MTLAPGFLLGPRLTLIDDEDVKVVEALGLWCTAPGCGQTPEPGAHHIEPRSRTGGPKKFVVIDGVIVANRVRLCHGHHLLVTGGIGGHKARIFWHESPRGHWCWAVQVDTVDGGFWQTRAPLRYSGETLEECDALTF